jgi:hypothetical protein
VANVAEISVIVTGSVAVGVPFISGAVSVLQQKLAAKSTRYDELRSVIDDAAVALMAFQRVQPVGAVRPDGTVDLPQLAEAVAKMLDTLKEIYAQEGRIAARLGTTHPLYVAHVRANQTASAFYLFFRHLLAEEPDDTDRLRLIEDQARAYGVFFDTAAALTGPDRSR